MRALPILVLLALPAFPNPLPAFLKKNCLACHSDSNRTAGLSLSDPNPARFPELLEKITSREMPPPGFPKPAPADVEAVAAHLKAEIDKADRNTPPDPGRVTARRLNKVEYDNTIRDLFHISLHPAANFPNDDSGYGFDNNGDVLSLSPALLERYLAAAEQVALAVLPPPAPNVLTVTRITSDRAKGDPSPGAMAITHRFPYHAEYEIEGRAAIVRGKGRFFLAVYLDNQHLKTAEVFPGDGPNRLTTVRATVTPGDHRIRAVFVDEQGEALTFSDPTQLVTDYIGIRGPFPLPHLPPTPAEHRLLLCHDHTPACAQKIVAALLPRAWRRPVTPAEIDRVARFVAAAPNLRRGLQLAIQAILVSPHFLFRPERDPASAAPVQPHELASRLSYFLWASMPDDELLNAAPRLRDPAELRRQVRRLLADPRASALTEHFAGQWLQLRNLESVAPDPVKFPTFDDGLRDAMIQETRHLFAHVLREDRPLTELLQSNYTFLNERLAAHYGIEGVRGPRFRKVDLPNPERGGLLTHAGILTLSSYPTRTSPVLRGKWILENLLNAPPPPPPAGVPLLDEKTVGSTQSLRAQLEEHRRNPNCAVCHNKMDPLGFGLENYDAIGRWRASDGKFPIDASGALPNGAKFESPAQLRQALSADPRQFTRAITEKLLTYALGRGVERYDNRTVQQITARVARENYRITALIEAIVESLPFQQRRGNTL